MDGRRFRLRDVVLDITTGVMLAEEGSTCLVVSRLNARARCIGLLCELTSGARFVLDPGVVLRGDELCARFTDLPLDGHAVNPR